MAGHQKILVVLSDMNQLEAWGKLATRLLVDEGNIIIRGLVTIEPDKSLSEGAIIAREWREALDKSLQDQAIPFQIESQVYVDYRPLLRILDEITTNPVDLMLVQWSGPSALTGGLTTDEIIERVSCDLVLLHGQAWQALGSVLFSLRGGPNLTLGLQLAKALANGAGITLFHAMKESTKREIANLEIVMQAELQVTRSLATSEGVVEGIVRESAHHKAIILGSIPRQLQRNKKANSTFIQDIYDQIDKTLALVYAHHPEDLAFHPPQPLPRPIYSLSTRVDRWFAENTFHSGEFADLKSLLDLKTQQGITISLGLPALNEEATLGNVIQTLKTALMDEIPLVDEMVLIDSHSTDNTVKIAEEWGIPVYRHPEILPDLGTYHGKGEALWKSLHVLKGDIIAWVDTDITNIHPRFIYGLLGPLLKYPHLQYVKGFYQRPIKVGEDLETYGGGRVTELVARPLLNLFYPELSGIIQPLSGEYAGRRTAFEQIPFFTGYGVETGLLIDLHQRFGLDAIAQTDLETRIHYNQPLVALSKMSFAIHQVFINRIEKRYGLQLLSQANRSMKLIIQEPERFGLEIQAITDIERPPILENKAYQTRHLKE